MASQTSETPTACPSWLQVSQFDVSGRMASDVSAHIAGCSRCAALLTEIDESRAELFGQSPAAQSALAARAILREAAARRRLGIADRVHGWIASWRRPVVLGGLASAAALGLVLVAGVRSPAPVADVPVAEGVRAKGVLALDGFCKRGEDVFAVADGASFVAGDRLQFAYSKGAAGYLMVFGVDDRGEVFPYYEDGRLAAVPVGAGARVMLPGSVELDAHHGWERVFALWSDRVIAPASVEEAVRSALTTVGGDVRKATRLPLPFEQVSYLLRRP